MTFAIPLALWAFAAVPVLIGLYFLRRRFRPKTVSALFLWQAPGLKAGGGRKLAPLENSLFLLLEVLIASLLAMAAAAPGCMRQFNIHNVAFVLDSSASMSARFPSGGSPKESAEKMIVAYLEKNAPFSCSLIMTGNQPKVLGTSLSNIKDVELALENWKVQKPVHAFNRTFLTARQLTGPGGKVIFLTDTPCEKEKKDSLLPADIECFSFGNALPNTGIGAASRNTDIINQREDIFLSLNNFSAKTEQLTVDCVSLENDKTEKNLLSKKLTIKPGERKNLSFEFSRVLDKALKVKISPGGAVKADDSVILLPEAFPPVRISSSLENKKLATLLDNTFKALGNKVVLTNKRPHLIISDNKNFLETASKESPEAWTILFLSAKAEKPKILYGPYAVAKQNPVCSELHIEGVRWAINGENRKKQVQPLITCGDYTLLSEASHIPGTARHFLFSFLPGNSNLQKTPAWPVLMHNFIKTRAEALPGFKRKNYRCGENAAGTFPETETAFIKYPDSTTDEIIPAGTEKIINILSITPGILEISTKEGKKIDTLSYNLLSPDESDLRKAGTGSPEKETIPGELVRASWRDEAWIFLLGAAFFLFLHIFLVFRKEKNS